MDVGFQSVGGGRVAVPPGVVDVREIHYAAHTNDNKEEDCYYLPVIKKKKMQTDPLDLSMKTLSRTLALEQQQQQQHASDTNSSSSSSLTDQDGIDGYSELMIVCDDNNINNDEDPDDDLHDSSSTVNGRRERKSSQSIMVERLLKSKRFLCFLCNYDCKSEGALQKHTTRMHSVKTNNGRVRCTVCGNSFDSFEILQSHQATYHSDKVDKKLAFYSCSHCKKQFRSEKQLAAHHRLLDKKNSWKEGVGKVNNSASSATNSNNNVKSKKSKAKSKSRQKSSTEPTPAEESFN